MSHIYSIYKPGIISEKPLYNKFVDLVDREMANAKHGHKAYLILKMNSLVDIDMILKLYEASEAGVKIKLIIRGVCSLVPGVKGLSENITVTSVIDRYLEHSRVYVFGNKGNEKIYLSSADWMTRNLTHRVEIAFPIYAAEIRKEIRDMLDFQLRDNVKGRDMVEPLANKMKPQLPGKPIIRSQYATYEYFMRNFEEQKAQLKAAKPENIPH